MLWFDTQEDGVINRLKQLREISDMPVCLSIGEEPGWAHQRRAWVSSFEKSFTSLLKRFAGTERTALLMTEEVVDNMSSSTFLVGISILCYLQS